MCIDINLAVFVSGAVKLDIELDKITIDQCTDSADVFSNTHRCQHSTFVSGFTSFKFLFIRDNNNIYSPKGRYTRSEYS